MRMAAWSACVLSTLATLALLAATKTSVLIGPLAAVTGIILVLIGLHFIYTDLRPEPFLGLATGGLATVCWGGLVAGATALAALRTGAPLIDDSLAQADVMLGLDTPALVAWVAQSSVAGWVLHIAYASVVPLVFASIIVLAWARREAAMWELCFGFTGSGVVCAFASSIVPAIGAFAHFKMSPDVLAALPPGAGLFHLPIFEAYRSGALDRIDLRHLEGVVTFPSFHAAMAIMVAYALRDLRWLFRPALVWSSLIVVSTVPIGGHYVVDLIAGAAVWVAFVLPYAHAGGRRLMPPGAAEPSRRRAAFPLRPFGS
jgi:membrane-associated phospholipid phosphatase